MRKGKNKSNRFIALKEREMESNNNGPLVLTPMECAKLLRCGRGTVYEAIRQNSIPHIHLGRKILIPMAALMKMLEGAQGEGSQP